MLPPDQPLAYYQLSLSDRKKDTKVKNKWKYSKLQLVKNQKKNRLKLFYTFYIIHMEQHAFWKDKYYFALSINKLTS